MFTYWPGRNTGASAGMSSTNSKAASPNGATSRTAAPNCAVPVLQAVEGTGTEITQSDLGIIWQVSTKPSSASSCVSASSM